MGLSFTGEPPSPAEFPLSFLREIPVVSAMPHILALDQGTTSSRAIVFDESGNAVASSQKEFTQSFPIWSITIPTN